MQGQLRPWWHKWLAGSDRNERVNLAINENKLSLLNHFQHGKLFFLLLYHQKIVKLAIVSSKQRVLFGLYHRGVNTKRPTLIFIVLTKPRNLSNHMDRQAPPPPGRSQTLPWWLGEGGVRRLKITDIGPADLGVCRKIVKIVVLRICPWLKPFKYWTGSLAWLELFCVSLLCVWIEGGDLRSGWSANRVTTLTPPSSTRGKTGRNHLNEEISCPLPHWDRRAIQPNHIKSKTCRDLGPMWTPPIHESAELTRASS